MKFGRPGALIVVVFVAFFGSAGTAVADIHKIELGLRAALGGADPSDTFIVWVYFEDRPDVDNDPEDRLPPVNSGCVEVVSSIPGVTPRWVDELFNALSVEATPRAVYEIAALSFVSEIRLVPRGCAIPEGCTAPRTTEIRAFSVDTRLVGFTAILSLIAGATVFLVGSNRSRREADDARPPNRSRQWLRLPPGGCVRGRSY